MTDPSPLGEAPRLSRLIADKVIERGRKHASGEPLFFDRYNLERVIEEVLVAEGEARRPSQVQHLARLHDRLVAMADEQNTRQQAVSGAGDIRDAAEREDVLRSAAQVIGAARRGPQPESIGAPTIEGDRIICSHCKATLYSIVKASPRPCQDDEPEAAPLVRSSAPPQPEVQDTKDDKTCTRLQSGATTWDDRIHADTSNGDK